MKASALISHLETLINEHGDLSVTVDGDEEKVADVAGIALGCDEQDHSQHFLICDRDTLDAYAD